MEDLKKEVKILKLQMSLIYIAFVLVTALAYYK